MSSARVYHGLSAVAALTALLMWLWTWPFNPLWALPICAVVGVLLWRHEMAWLIVMPMAWPVIDLVPLTGRIYFTESDALAALIVAVLGLRAMLAPAGQKPRRHAAWLCILLFALLALSYVISSAKLLWPLPPLGDNAFVGYDSPYNALRLAKGLLWALLLLPHWRRAQQADNAQAIDWLSIGLTAGLTTCSLAALQERAAFSALLDFSSNYRTTASFWEMNVGGAALDGWLMLTMPFAVYRFIKARSPASLALHGAIVLLGGYAAFTTFSRGVYLGCALMLLAALPQYLRSKRAVAKEPVAWRWIGCVFLPGAAIVGVASFRSGGYRGLAAQLIACTLIYFAASVVRRMRVLHWVLIGIVLTPLVALGFALHDVIPKLPYWMFAVTCIATAFLLYYDRHKHALQLVIALLLACVVSWAALICWHWGNGNNFSGMVISCLAIGGVLIAQSVLPKPLWLPHLAQLPTLSIAGLIVASAAVGAGSYFVDARFSTTAGDLDDRLTHWKTSLSLIGNNQEWLTGIGVGRYSDRFFWQSPVDELPGTWHLGHDDENHFLTLGGSHFAQLMRVTQRLDATARGPFVLHLRARAANASTLRAEVCHKHLIYPVECLVAWEMKVPAGNTWAPLSYVLPDKLSDSAWYASAPISFSLMLYMNGQATQVTDVDLIDAGGVSVLKNGNFEAGIDRWFFSSDRVHLPWHAKNIFVHMLVEQGWLGVGSFCLCLLAACLRLVSMPAAPASRVAAPAFLAALGGVVAVGLFDSLLDVPRDALFVYLLLGISLMLPTKLPPVQKP
jgi:hypothetical protein